jgi:hypothetical protein
MAEPVPPSRAPARRRLLGVLVASLGLAALAPTCTSTSTSTSVPAAEAAVEPDDVRTIEDFVSCLNGRLADSTSVDVSDSVQCLPKNCSITLTMSDTSAQPACFSESGSCQMPRVLLSCPGPPLFMPSFSLCHTDGGSKRIEIGEAIDAAANMRMADIHFPEGIYTEIDPDEILSPNDEKGCNSNGSNCHAEFTPPNTTFKYSGRIDPWTVADNGNPNCIIDTDRCEPDKQAITEPKECYPPTDGSRLVKPQSLAQVCECIRENRAGFEEIDGEFEYIEKLCDALVSYQATRGACAAEGCPAATGPDCEEPGAPCDPATGATSITASGHHCQPSDEEGFFECVADCPCRHYDLLGGGKFLVNGAVCMVRVELDGLEATPDPDDFQFLDDGSITGSLSAFDYLTRTQIDSVSFSSLSATKTGADFSAIGAGKALVNGVEKNVEFTATQTGSQASFELVDADTDQLLCGSSGESGRAAFQLTVGP